ncbi:hypothetical protein [Phocaeicola massiliensis]|uniref:hypothetical protein n=1 Tax=Phocaeicola massiliensis TaxID=204516 RepID=UPI002030F407|nr:hypothetical protein [Phocaeicola massiliensis]MCM1708097.1 hypothetical protein [Phocaeicola massiliensis]
MGRTKPYKYSHPTLSGKRRLYNRKNNKVHSEKSRRLKRTAALETKDPNSYIPIYSLKSWDVWVGNKAREHIILQDDT